MKSAVAFLGALIISSGSVEAVDQPKILSRVTPLPMALSKDFQFRKTKLFFLSERDDHANEQGGSNTTSTKTGKVGKNAPSSKSSTVQEASIRFERQYRLFGAVTALDRRQRFGYYFDFFWRARQPADITVRLEYRQEKLHSHIQAQEISYANARGSHKTEFKVVGDDYFDDGRVIAWRCVLIENGAIVAEDRSYLWE